MNRKPRLLWANACCLLDSSSGAAMLARQMLLQLVSHGYEVAIAGATVFDAESGLTPLRAQWPEIQQARTEKKIITIADGPLKHHLLVTGSTKRGLMTAHEAGNWLGLYLGMLEDFRPDLVFYYGGFTLDLLIADEARVRGIPAVALLVNGNYSGTRWCRDVDLIVTDSQATADYYAKSKGYPPLPVGAFIAPERVVAAAHTRERILFINPSPAKGVGIVILLALLLEKRRPDILFEVVESRGNWRAMLHVVTRSLGTPRATLDNVVVTPNTTDMRPVFGRARLLLAPSLWWESGPRVAAEAMLNGIPAIVTDRGGSPQMIGNAGIKLQLPANCYEKPYHGLPRPELLAPLVERIMRFYDDPAYYDAFVARAYHVGRTRHSLEASTRRLLDAFAPLVAQQAGDLDSAALQRQWHKHGVSKLSE